MVKNYYGHKRATVLSLLDRTDCIVTCHEQGREFGKITIGWILLLYANVLRSMYKDLLNITPKREKTPYNVSSRWLEMLSEFFRDGIPIIMTAEFMVSDQALSNWFQYPTHADNMLSSEIDVLRKLCFISRTRSEVFDDRTWLRKNASG